MRGTTDIIAITIGNSRTQSGRFLGHALVDRALHANEDPPAIVEQVMGWWKEAPEDDRPTILVASVEETMTARLVPALRDQLSVDPYLVGEDLPVPVRQALDHETITGQDRLLNALAAYDLVQQACLVVDAGTAITVDFVDGEGTFHGGSILPGASLQLLALHEHTAALPELDYAAPDDTPFGRSTAQAMLHGVHHGIRGAVRLLLERTAEHYAAYPVVVATGGDAELLFAEDELVERIVPELTLLGIAACVRHAMAAEDGD